jgi:hypothetical protein
MLPDAHLGRGDSIVVSADPIRDFCPFSREAKLPVNISRVPIEALPTLPEFGSLAVGF